MDLSVNIGDILFKNPIWVASGTFCYGEEFKSFLDLDRVGAVVTKTVTLKARQGNPPPRIVETSSGLLNSIGIENHGVEHLKQHHFPFLEKLNTRVIISIAGPSLEDFTQCAEILCEEESKYKRTFPDAIELNLSCPNIAYGKNSAGLIAQDPVSTEKMVSAIKKKVSCLIIAKLTPNVTHIASIAKAAEQGGADAVSLVNTYSGIAIDAEKRRPVLGNKIGGLSGPAIKPLALKAIWDVYQHVSIPIIGIGGIMTGIDVAEFILSGATAIQLGTTNLIDPTSHHRILKEFTAYLERQGVQEVDELRGGAHNDSSFQ